MNGLSVSWLGVVDSAERLNASIGSHRGNCPDAMGISAALGLISSSFSTELHGIGSATKLAVRI